MVPPEAVMELAYRLAVSEEALHDVALHVAEGGTGCHHAFQTFASCCRCRGG